MHAVSTRLYSIGVRRSSAGVRRSSARVRRSSGTRVVHMYRRSRMRSVYRVRRSCLLCSTPAGSSTLPPATVAAGRPTGPCLLIFPSFYHCWPFYKLIYLELRDQMTFKSFFLLFMYIIQHCFICRRSDSTVSEDAGIEPTTVAT
jgi:hypothetical protein